MLISEFVSFVLKELEILPKPLSLSEMQNLFSLFIRRQPMDPRLVERSHYPTELVDFLNSHQDSTLVTTRDNLRPFINLLSERWEKIKHSERSYHLAPDDIANRAYMIVGRHLAQVLNDNLYDPLMPNEGLSALLKNMPSFTPDTMRSYFWTKSRTDEVEIIQCYDQPSVNESMKPNVHG